MRKRSFGERKNPWLENLLFELRAAKIIEALLLVGGLKTVADLGCGYHGRLLQKLVARFPQIGKAVGVDLSVAAASLHAKIELVAADLGQRLPLANDTYDAVICAAVIEHIPGYQYALGEMRRVLKDQGRLILTSPAPGAKKILEFLAFGLGLINPAEISDHKNYFSADDLEKILTQADFSQVTVRPWQFGFNNLVIAKK